MNQKNDFVELEALYAKGKIFLKIYLNFRSITTKYRKLERNGNVFKKIR